MIELENLQEEDISLYKKAKKKRLNSKLKGSNNERECAKIFVATFGDGFFKTPQSGGWAGASNQSLREGATLSQKLTLVSDIMTPENFKFIIEHKAYASANFWDFFNPSSDLFKWFEQVERDALYVNKKPLLIVKYNNKKRIAFAKEEFDDYVLKLKNNWYCYWLEDLLKLDRTFFFD